MVAVRQHRHGQHHLERTPLKASRRLRVERAKLVTLRTTRQDRPVLHPSQRPLIPNVLSSEESFAVVWPELAYSHVIFELRLLRRVWKRAWRTAQTSGVFRRVRIRKDGCTERPFVDKIQQHRWRRYAIACSYSVPLLYVWARYTVLR